MVFLEHILVRIVFHLYCNPSPWCNLRPDPPSRSPQLRTLCSGTWTVAVTLSMTRGNRCVLVKGQCLALCFIKIRCPQGELITSPYQDLIVCSLGPKPLVLGLHPHGLKGGRIQLHQLPLLIILAEQVICIRRI